MAKKYTGSNEGQETIAASGLEIDGGTLYVDAANNRVGIGTKTPDSAFDISISGTAKANTDLITLTNEVNAADMDGTETSILFNQYYYDASTPALADAARITVGTEQDWTSTGSTQDAYLAFETALNGTVTEYMRLTSNGVLGIGITPPDANAKLYSSGAIALSEITTPTATTNYGKIYTKADDQLYFQSGAGNEQKVTEEIICIACSDETTNLTTGNAKVTFHMPFAMTLTAVKVTVTTAPVGSTIIVDIEEAGATILTTLLTIDAGEKTSSSAGTPAVIGGAGPALADDALMIINIDQIGSSTAGTGLKVWLYGYKA